MASLDYRTEKLNFNSYYESKINDLEEAKKTLAALISSILNDEGFEVHTITGRVKNKNECIRKFTLKYQAILESEQEPYSIVDCISDLIGLRIVLLYEPDINKVGEVLQREFVLLEKTDKSKLLEDGGNTFGYKGLHLNLKISEPRASMHEYKKYADFAFEVQIRTIIQDAWSVLDHKIKYKKSISKNLERRVNSLSALFEIADREFLNIQKESKDEIHNVESALNVEESITSLTFHALVSKHLPDLPLPENRLSEFVEYLLSFGELSCSTLESYIAESDDIIHEYFDSMWKKIGENYLPDAFSYILYILHFSSPQVYRDIMPEFSSKAFDSWYASRSH